MKLPIRKSAILLFVCAATAMAQPPQGRGPGGPPMGGPGIPGDRETPPPPRPNRPPMERSLPPGTWWRNPEMAQKLGINSDQEKKIEDVFQQHRLTLVDLDAAVRKEEITLEPLMSADSPDEAKTLAQIDKVAQARAELEKANARFLFAIRRVLTADQWKKLQEISRPDGGLPRGPGGRGGR
ncbi:MAG TPA: periplasmic heavy metal sensor [Bryobacteraceae bacterium]|nr:periplasmic heavy metal sensor [Bryobacteraceae bacterium]